MIVLPSKWEKILKDFNEMTEFNSSFIYLPSMGWLASPPGREIRGPRYVQLLKKSRWNNKATKDIQKLAWHSQLSRVTMSFWTQIEYQLQTSLL